MRRRPTPMAAHRGINVAEPILGRVQTESTIPNGPVHVLRVADRIRTGDRLDHNQELYQLSYSHRAPPM